MSISYEYYKIFYYVARYESFNRAAKVLLNSQPNIARAINNLESELDTTLFERSHRGVTLTEPGKVLYEYISETGRRGSSLKNAWQYAGKPFDRLFDQYHRSDGQKPHPSSDTRVLDL